MIRVLILFSIIIILFLPLKAQDKDIKIGKIFPESRSALFDLSDPSQINIRVSIWGAVNAPGNYMVPQSTSVLDLISLAGGPTDDAKLDDLRIYRNGNDSTGAFIKFNLNELYSKETKKDLVLPPTLIASDVILIPSEPKMYWKDYLTLSLSATTALISLAVLIVNLVN